MTPLSESSYREITLTQGQVAIVSVHRHAELAQWKWCAMWSEDTQSFYAVRIKAEGVEYIFRMQDVISMLKGLRVQFYVHETGGRLPRAQKIKVLP